ncbi:CbiQ family ECF transporter T component [Geopsychrobacter electrodiphilus]|uniref:CbiQ family ECF transporter T component n=1 Tax=Geopsychrobacter electrodiphilus TaxID=225196 RepID=UPI00036932BA|nr:CbiQ family ECF transporter T component [Geopsychrobacter electrodiphilus]
MSSLLQQYDPRLKLVLLLILVITIFSASGFRSLLLVGALVAGLLFWQPSLFNKFIQHLKYIRWLLLFTLLVHVFLTPGRVLFGLRMLSYDGLLRGLMVDLQLVLALFFTLFFSLITTPSAVAWGAAKVLSPLGRLGLPVEEAGGLLALVLHFLPQVFQLGAPLVEQARQADRRTLIQRFQVLAKSLGEAVLALVGQADQLAQSVARGEKKLVDSSELSVWHRRDSLGFGVGLIFVALCWSL